MLQEDLVMHKMVVLVPFRNVGAFIIDCVNSVLEQYYDNYEVYLLDDASDNDTLDLIDEDFGHIRKIRNDRRMGPTENVYRHLMGLPIKDEDIIVLLDGDDYLLGKYALQIVNAKYNDGALLTYGQYINNYGQIGHCSPYTREEFRDLRKAPWKASHLKSFKYKLFKEFIKQDPDGVNLKFNDGQFYMAASDQSIMIPLMEIAGFENSGYISNVIYCYRQHPGNDHSSSQGLTLQTQVVDDMRAKPSLKRAF
ncbi:glycosyltransferase family 2 protein [Chitinophaga sp. YIM B06452]|uniref:glycosyltransferase family 2 protein n=1 Tax=Chitinophaga sp. YIM B06452 TaxID=3082158 RepID=UPI0031FE5133